MARRLFRTMRADDDGKPMLGEGARYLGIRVPPNETADVEPDVEGNVHPGPHGLSVTPDDPRGLPRTLRPTALGGKAKDPLWELDDDDLPDGLVFNDDEPTHGFVGPSKEMPAEEFTRLVHGLRDKWRRA